MLHDMLDLGFGFLLKNYVYSRLETCRNSHVGENITKFIFAIYLLDLRSETLSDGRGQTGREIDTKARTESDRYTER